MGQNPIFLAKKWSQKRGVATATEVPDKKKNDPEIKCPEVLFEKCSVINKIQWTHQFGS